MYPDPGFFENLDPNLDRDSDFLMTKNINIKKFTVDKNCFFLNVKLQNIFILYSYAFTKSHPKRTISTSEQDTIFLVRHFCLAGSVYNPDPKLRIKANQSMTNVR